jgi:hypothetical protein
MLNVGGTGVTGGVTGVAVRGMGVAVGASGVAVSGTDVGVGGSGVAVGGTGVGVGAFVGAGASPPHPASIRATSMIPISCCDFFVFKKEESKNISLKPGFFLAPKNCACQANVLRISRYRSK